MKGTPIAQTLAEFCIAKEIIVEKGISINSDEDSCICGHRVFKAKPIRVFHFLPLICCNNCGTISDFSKSYVFSTPPVRFQDIDEGGFPLLSLSFSSLIFSNPNWEEVKRVSDLLHNCFFENFIGIPSMLKHFTNKNGAFGIIRSSEFWAFNTSNMNDPNEITHAQELINNVYKGLRNGFSGDVKEIFDRAVGIISSEKEREMYFIACFSGSHKSSYHWGNYASYNQGIALGISSNYLGLTDNLQIRQVIYDDAIKIQLVTQVFNEINGLYEKLSKKFSQWSYDESLASFAALVSYHLIEFLFTFKEHKWSDGKEYRLILKNESKTGLIIGKRDDKKFVRIKLSQPAPDINLLPIVAVFFGTNTPENNKIAVCKTLVEMDMTMYR